MDDAALDAFWARARRRARIGNLPGYLGPSTLEVVTPPAWSFGAGADEADRLLALVLEGTKTATSSAYQDYLAEDEPLPEVGTMSIVVDGQGRPRALVSVTAVAVVPFDEVPEAHAQAEGEGDLSLAGWRRAHQELLTRHDRSGRWPRPDLPVVLERFQVLHQE